MVVLSGDIWIMTPSTFGSRLTLASEFVRRKHGAVALAAILLLSGCEKQNALVPPAPPEVEVAVPIQRAVSLHLNQTGTTEAVATVDLVARVEGFLTDIKYRDGD